MIAGECFMEPEVGSLRLVRGKVLGALDDADAPGRTGILVEEYVELDFDGWRRGWQTVCPLTDAHFMVDGCPVKWDRASCILRDRLEAGESLTLADEIAALKGVRPSVGAAN